MNKKIVILFLTLVGLSVIGVFVFSGLNSNRSSTGNPTKPIVKVGEETLYQGDLDYELSFLPESEAASQKETLMNKIISDSIVLQAGASAGIVQLEASFYNAKTKDYAKRFERVDQVKKSVESKADNLAGTIITVWFFNNEYVGPLGYEKSKEFARQKITAAHAEAKSGKKTLAQIAEDLKKDTSLLQLDPGYKNNVVIEFNKTKDRKITFDDKFNEILWDLSVGEISDVHVLVDTQTRNKIPTEAMYAFAQITEKKSEGKIVNYKEWLEENKKNYKVEYIK